MGYGYQNFITRQIPTALLFCICFNYFVLHNITSSFTTSNVIKPSRQTRANNNEKHHLKHPFVLQVQPTMSLASGRKLKTRQPSLPIHTLSLLLWPATQRQVAIHPCKTPATRHHRQAHLLATALLAIAAGHTERVPRRPLLRPRWPASLAIHHDPALRMAAPPPTHMLIPLPQRRDRRSPTTSFPHASSAPSPCSVASSPWRATSTRWEHRLCLCPRRRC